jgi:multiple sugar transport system substrate-binding protein
MKDHEVKELWEGFKSGRVSRRSFMRQAALLGVGVVSTSSLLAACGDNTATTAATTAAATTAAPAATTAAATTAAATTAAGTTVAGATTAAGTTAAATTAAAGAKITGVVNYWSRETASNGVRQPLINARLKAFEAVNPGVTTKVQYQVLAESLQKTEAGLQTGTAPELGQYGPSVLIGYAAAKQLLPLDDVFADLKDKMIHLEKESFTEVDGVNYGIPWYAETRVLFYHKDLLEKAGVTPPTTWDEWAEAAKKLTTGEQYGFIHNYASTSAGQFWMPLAISAGGMPLDKDGNVTVNTQPFRDALTFAADFLKNKTMPEAAPTYQSAETAKLFQLKQVAMYVNNGQALEDLRGVDPKVAEGVGSVLVPVRTRGDISRSFLGGYNLAVFAKSKNPDGGKALLRYMYEDPWYTDYMKSTNAATLPILKSAADSDFYSKNPNYATLVKQLSTAVGPSGPVYGNAAFMYNSQQAYADALIRVVTNKSNVADSITTLESDLNKLKKA